MLRTVVWAIKASISHRTRWLVVGRQMTEQQLKNVCKGRSLSTILSAIFGSWSFDPVFVISVSQYSYFSSRNNIWKQPRPLLPIPTSLLLFPCGSEVGHPTILNYNNAEKLSAWQNEIKFSWETYTNHGLARNSGCVATPNRVMLWKQGRKVAREMDIGWAAPSIYNKQLFQQQQHDVLLLWHDLFSSYFSSTLISPNIRLILRILQHSWAKNYSYLWQSQSQYPTCIAEANNTEIILKYNFTMLTEQMVLW